MIVRTIQNWGKIQGRKDSIQTNQHYLFSFYVLSKNMKDGDKQ